MTSRKPKEFKGSIGVVASHSNSLQTFNWIEESGCDFCVTGCDFSIPMFHHSICHSVDIRFSCYIAGIRVCVLSFFL